MWSVYNIFELVSTRRIDIQRCAGQMCLLTPTVNFSYYTDENYRVAMPFINESEFEGASHGMPGSGVMRARMGKIDMFDGLLQK